MNWDAKLNMKRPNKFFYIYVACEAFKHEYKRHIDKINYNPSSK